MIAVTFALPAESSEFLSRLKDKSRADRNGIRVIRGKIDDRDIEILHTGVGEKVCRQRVEKFLQDHQFDLLITTGFAGALNDELQPGDLLLAKNFSTIDLNERGLSCSSLPIHVADLLTVSALVDSSNERNKISRASNAAAVDMETEFIARACATHGIPLLSLRVITDTPTQPFPAPPSVLFDIQRQRTHIAVLTKFFLADPRRIPGLLQFARRISRARKTLANALVSIVRSQVGAIDRNGLGRFG
jgi:nucleoside phosphorylase